jgi:hypothetical protein
LKTMCLLHRIQGKVDHNSTLFNIKVSIIQHQHQPKLSALDA